MNRGNLYIISAPSGAGKTTLCKRVLEGRNDISFSVSHTTRQPRTGEEDGVHYHFVPVAEFMAMIDMEEFLEWAEVHGNFYGTGIASVRSEMEKGRDVVLDIDVQGAEQVKRHFPDAISVFIMPPSMEELETRLRRRGTDSEDVIARRLENAAAEMARVHEYDYIIVNDDLDRASGDLTALFRACRCRAQRVLAMNPWISRMAGME
jgi:guanylate kinase